MSPPLPPGYLSPNFTLAELTLSQAAVRMGADNHPDGKALANLQRTALLLEEVRVLLGGAPILVSSGFRSLAVNRAVGSDDTSAHVLGLAADFTAPRFGTPLQICRVVQERGPWFFDQLIFEGSWVHLGLSPEGVKPRREVRHAVFRAGQRTVYPMGLPA